MGRCVKITIWGAWGRRLKNAWEKMKNGSTNQRPVNSTQHSHYFSTTDSKTFQRNSDPLKIYENHRRNYIIIKIDSLIFSFYSFFWDQNKFRLFFLKFQEKKEFYENVETKRKLYMWQRKKHILKIYLKLTSFLWEW